MYQRFWCIRVIQEDILSNLTCFCYT
jgi:hypothetical protein